MREWWGMHGCMDGGRTGDWVWEMKEGGLLSHPVINDE